MKPFQRFVTWQWLFFLLHFLTACSMFHKRGRQDQDEPNLQKRFRHNVGDLFLGNQISGVRTQSVYSDAQMAGAQHVSDLARTGGEGMKPGNASRDLRNKFRKGKGWPAIYRAKLRVWSPKLQRETTAIMSIALPHELMGALAKKNSTAALLSQGGMSKACLEHLLKMCADWGKPELAGIGLWCDGVPYNFDRTQSLEVVSLSLPGLEGGHAALRLPVFAVNKKFLMTDSTYDDLFAVLAWSFRALAHGTCPAQRHDGTPFGSSDSKRRRSAGQPIGIAAALVEVRGDWSMMAHVFRFPAWNTKRGCCWMCEATPATIRQCGSDGAWRTQRLGHFEFLARMLQFGLTISTLFGVPGLTTSCFKPDWLHTVDQGCAADFLGGLLWTLLPFFAGSTQKVRCQNMFLDIRAFYTAHNVDSRYDNFSVKMFHTKQLYKLRGKAAEVRALVPWAKLACDRFLHDGDVQHETIRQACHELAACYDQLSQANFNVDAMAQHCRKFCVLSVALEHVSQTIWKVKPKLHLMQELCEMQGDNPAKYWTYRDEDFGGSCAQYCRHRGGANSFHTSGTSLLQRFYSLHKVPLLD